MGGFCAASMDFLKSLVSSKKRELEDSQDAGSASGKKKWKRRGDAMKEQAPESNDVPQMAEETTHRIVQEEKPHKKSKVVETPAPVSPTPTKEKLLSKAECFSRLRAMGEPITFFGESDYDRHLRTMKAQ